MVREPSEDRRHHLAFRCPLLTVGVLAVVGGASGAAAAGDLIPRDAFFGNPDRASVSISPDGSRLAYLAPHNDLLNVWVRSVDRDDAKPVTGATERPIMAYFWAANGEQIIFVQDRGGDENFRLYAVDLTSGEEIVLTPWDNVQARLVAADRNHPNTILVAVNNRVPQLHDVWRIDTRTGQGEVALLNDQGWIGFTADSDLTVRVTMRMNAQGGSDAFIRATPDSEWLTLASWDMEDAMTSAPLGFSRDGSTLYMIDSRNANTAGIYAGSFGEDGALRTQLLHRSPNADVSDGLLSPIDGRLQAVAAEHARVEWHVLDEALEDDWRRLRAVRDGDFRITSRSEDDSVWTVAFTVDDGPVHHYVYRRHAGASPQAEFLFTNRTALEGLALARMEPVIIKSRDGLDLVSYLTLPTGSRRADRPRLPMVLMVHGGPWARDSWGYNPVHQWLANRGYAVLSVNFRGSTGFGKEFINAGNREWAGRMHDDLLDAVEWAIAEGVADRDRVAIMGGSYGGYATLVGLTFTPEVFAAGVSIVGPSHIRTLLESIPPYWRPLIAMFETRVGALAEPDYLDSISPLTKVDRIVRPLLIGQGANDPRVKEAESEQIVAAMRERDIPVTYVIFPDEGHGFARPVNNLAFFAVTEAFLAEHLGGRFEPIGDALKPSSAKVPAGADLVPGLSVSTSPQE